jgi:hypothetical protein
MKNANARCFTAVFDDCRCLWHAGTEEELDSDEESGKDWDELEEEAKRGMLVCGSDELTEC